MCRCWDGNNQDSGVKAPTWHLPWCDSDQVRSSTFMVAAAVTQDDLGWERLCQSTTCHWLVNYIEMGVVFHSDLPKMDCGLLGWSNRQMLRPYHILVSNRYARTQMSIAPTLSWRLKFLDRNGLRTALCEIAPDEDLPLHHWSPKYWSWKVLPNSMIASVKATDLRAAAAWPCGGWEGNRFTDDIVVATSGPWETQSAQVPASLTGWIVLKSSSIKERLLHRGGS